MRGAGRHRLTTAFDAVADAPWPDDVQRDEALLELLRVTMASVHDSDPSVHDRDHRLPERARPRGGAVALTA